MKLFLLSLCIASALLTNAQTPENNIAKIPGRTSFYAELGGPGILFSANIDTRFKPSHLGLGGRIGVGFVTTEDYNSNTYRTRSVLTVPIQLNYVFGRAESPHTFEAGAGVTILGKKLDILNFDEETRSSVYGTASFMYRRQPVNGGFTWRIGFTPLIGNGYIQPFGAIGVGYNF